MRKKGDTDPYPAERFEALAAQLRVIASDYDRVSADMRSRSMDEIHVENQAMLDLALKNLANHIGKAWQAITKAGLDRAMATQHADKKSPEDEAAAAKDLAAKMKEAALKSPQGKKKPSRPD